MGSIQGTMSFPTVVSVMFLNVVPFIYLPNLCPSVAMMFGALISRLKNGRRSQHVV